MLEIKNSIIGLCLSLATFCLIALAGCTKQDDVGPEFQITSLQLNNRDLLSDSVAGAALKGPITASFSLPVDTASFEHSIGIKDDEGGEVALRFNFFNGNKTIAIYPQGEFETYTQYSIEFDEVLSADGQKKFSGSGYQFSTTPGKLTLESIVSGTTDLATGNKEISLPLDLQIVATFSAELDPQTINGDNVFIKKGSKEIPVSTTVDGNVLTITSGDEIDYWTTYKLIFESDLEGIGAVDFEGFETTFITELDSTLKFPEISDEELLTKVQEQTFKYFWDFGHPVSGLARERNTSGETVTSGGSGFGLMAILVGIERGFITRQEGIDRLDKIITFLGEKADRFHGAWSHWLNGTTGTAQPFSANDDGGDLVETAFMVQGLLTVRQYLDAGNEQELAMIAKINTLWEGVEWDWYTQGGQDVLYWHWSPNFGWEKNHRITGWNESMIVYVLAASSPTHTVDKEVYTDGWSRNGAMVNSSGVSHYGHTLDLRSDRGGPLFFSHYSFLGLDPRNLSDQFANYWDQNVNHSLINHDYCVDNPKGYVGYSQYCWGLTASDGNSGYAAHSPNNDRGVITPTAAISSIPYTPEESMDVIRHFYYILGDRLWGEYGFYDAFNPTENWTASSYLAIDQGPIVVMIENYRTGMLWDLFMSAPEVQNGLEKLEITYE